MPDLLHRISNPGDGGDTVITVAALLEAHIRGCDTCREGNTAACPEGLALTHALAAAIARDVARALGQEPEG